MKIVFMGSAEFGIPALQTLMKKHDVAAVVTTPARPKGRGLKLCDSPVCEFAKENNIAQIFTPENLLDENFINEMKSIAPDLFVVIAFRILPRAVFTIPKFGTVNVHASLLPRYRGAAPIHRAIEAGERESGVTVFKIDDGVDTGEIIAVEKISIGSEETTPQLYERLSALGADTLANALDNMATGNIALVPQDATLATRAPKLTKQEGLINWNLSAQEIFNKVRAFKPFPGTYFFLNGKKINIEWGTPINDAQYETVNAAPGTVLHSKGDYIDILCGKGVLRITKVKPEGRPAMDVKSFLLGKRERHACQAYTLASP